ncbi:MAG TPA: hypothetical protein VFM95_02635 [Microcella sp.]|nr:hypothetical protein [Microcella sp.]
MGRAEDIQELRALKASDKLSPEVRTQVLAKLAEFEDQGVGEWAAAAPHALEAEPVAPGELGVKGVIGKGGTSFGAGGQVVENADPAATASVADAEAERVAGMLDPRFSLVPQVLALQPATSDPQSDEAARQRWQGGDKDAVIVYEPPVAVVQKHLLENPALLRALRPDEPPALEEIAALDAGSPLYQEAADYMWRKTKEAADKGGRRVLRQSKLPWLSEDPEMPQSLEVRVQNAATEGTRAARAFVMGTDDTALLGVARAVHERLQPEGMLDRPTLGVNESVPQKTADLNAWETEQNPIAYGGGQLYGGTANWGVANRLWKSVQEGGEMLGRAVAKTRLGATLAELHPFLRGAGGVVGDTAAGSAAAAATQVGQEVVDAAGRGEVGDLAEAGERVKDVGLLGGGLAAAGGLAGRAAGGGADAIRKSARFSGPSGPGAVGRTEQNLDYRLGRAPRPKGEVAKLYGTGDQPGDLIAEQIAPPIRDAAQANTRAAKALGAIERRAYQATPEGAAQPPLSHLERMSLERLRDFHQPGPDGTLRAVGPGFREAQQVFNRHVRDVSLEPSRGAIELTPDEAGTFLNARARYKLLKDDIEAAQGRAQGAQRAPIHRDDYLRTIKDSRARAAADEEIEASIEDIVGDATPSPARRAKAEQQVLQELVDEASFVEANGELADYLKQRGKDRVYVTPAGADARRIESIVDGLKDPDLIEAAKYDRQQFTKGGQRGGYELMRRRQDERVAKAERAEKRVAPDGDAFAPVAGLYQSRPGEKQLVDEVRALADQAGVREQLDRLRSLQETEALVNRASWRGPGGDNRSVASPQNAMDAFQLRLAFPALRALEGPLGPLRGGNAGRAALLGRREDTDRQRADVTSERGRYEAARARRLKEIEQERAEEERESERLRTEKIRRRR